MKKAFARPLIGLLLCLFMFPATVNACRSTCEPTDSVEPVTIKMSNTYFQIPEKYFSCMFERVPSEKDRIEITGAMVNTLTLKVHSPNDGIQAGEYKLLDNIEVSTDADLPSLNEEAFEYVKSLGTKTPPSTWENDISLENKIGLIGQSPCSENYRESAAHPSFADIKEALKHRNQAFRERAADLLAMPQFQNEKGIKDILLNVLSDNSGEVRAAAMTPLGNIAKTDRSIIPIIVQSLLEDKSSYVRHVAALVLGWTGSDTDGEFVQQVVPAIKVDNIEQTKAIADSLTGYLSNETRIKKIKSADELSASGSNAFNAIQEIIKKTPDEATRKQLVWALCSTGLSNVGCF